MLCTEGLLVITNWKLPLYIQEQILAPFYVFPLEFEMTLLKALCYLLSAEAYDAQPPFYLSSPSYPFHLVAPQKYSSFFFEQLFSPYILAS